jgi:curved DNA-binding protein CbpA
VNSYYDLLGVPPHATEMEIRSAYGRDVLRLQESASDKVAQFRAALDAAFATLVDPTKRSAYDEALAAAAQDSSADASDEADAAFRYARRGGFWFAGGALVTAVTTRSRRGRTSWHGDRSSSAASSWCAAFSDISRCLAPAARRLTLWCLAASSRWASCPPASSA